MKLVNKNNEKFTVEMVKGQKIPSHFFAAEKATIKIDDVKVDVYRNKERTEYVAFEMNEIKYYVRDHNFFDQKSVTTFVKPVTEKSKTARVTKAMLLELLKANNIEVTAPVAA